MSKTKKNTKFSTKTIHVGNRIDETGAAVTPLHLTSTFRQPSFSSTEKFVYSRTGGPTIAVSYTHLTLPPTPYV